MSEKPVETIVREVKEPYIHIRYNYVKSEKFPKIDVEISVMGEFTKEDIEARIVAITMAVDGTIGK